MTPQKPYVIPIVRTYSVVAPQLLSVSGGSGPGAGDIDPPDVDGDASGTDDDDSQTAKPFGCNYDLWEDGSEWQL